MKHFILPILLFLSWSCSLYGQNDLKTDQAFFEAQAKKYQKWLEKTGLASVINVHSIELDSNLALYLKFPGENPDSCQAQWERLSTDFKSKQNIRLEQKLFYQLTHLMELPQSKVNIQIYNTYDLSKTYCYFYAIYFEEGKVQTHEEICRSKQLELDIAPFDLDGIRTMSSLEFDSIYKKSAVFEALYDYAERRYTKNTCELRHPQVRELERGEVLRFEVIDLCKEVLEDETDSKICEWLRYFGKSCNWIKREKLEFLIGIESQEEGFKLLVDLNGKFGSGYYEKVKRGGYQDMEPDFDEYLEAYADRMKLEFKKVIDGLSAVKP